MPTDTPHRHATVTLWFLDSRATPSTITSSITRTTTPDRGFGRKFLAQLGPQWPVTCLGDFPLNRSIPAGDSEFYIGTFGLASVIQTVPATLPSRSRGRATTFDPTHLSRMPATWRHPIPARTVLAFTIDGDLGGFARWDEGRLTRSLVATPTHIYENIGLPHPFEHPHWAGTTTPSTQHLPFTPADLVADAHRHWLGFDVTRTGIDIPVTGFAVDGRPEPSMAPTLTPSTPHPTPTTYTSIYTADPDDDYYTNAGPQRPQITDVDAEDVTEAIETGARKLSDLLRTVATTVATVPTAIGDHVRARAANPRPRRRGSGTRRGDYGRSHGLDYSTPRKPRRRS